MSIYNYCYIFFIICLLVLIDHIECFKCGSNKFEEDIATSVVDLNCKGQKAFINKCCLQHDRCYERQAPKKNCDQVFCDCLVTASKGNALCQTMGTSHMCNVVRLFGQTAYNNAKKTNVDNVKKTNKKAKPEESKIEKKIESKKRKSKAHRNNKKNKVEQELKKEEESSIEEKDNINTTEAIII
uniref:Phospholipase A(2) n=1 Tax=Parastrongyloides trichosuri TaxID=131310 RepID=A0A0N4ZHY7_PARTI